MTKEEMLTLRAMMAEVVKDELDKTLDRKIDTFRVEIDAKFDALRTEMKDENQKLLTNIVDAVENQITKMNMRYEHEVDSKLKALSEETAVLRETVKDHEQRIHTVERKVGIAI